MFRLSAIALIPLLAAGLVAQEPKTLYKQALSVTPPAIASDKSVTYDFDIVYVRAPRPEKGRGRWAEVGDPRTMEPGSDLMLLHPDGKEEVLVAAAANEAIADPFVSFDGQSVYFAKMHDAVRHKGADIYKVHVPTRKVTRLTEQNFTPNTGVTDWKKTGLPSWGVYNLGPCPVPGGKIVFVSDRNAFKASNPAMRRTLSPCNFSSWTRTAATSNASAISTSAWLCIRSF